MQNFDDVKIEKIIGSGGDFIVEVDGEIVFSKNGLIGTDRVRLPNGGEITRLIREKLA